MRQRCDMQCGQVILDSGAVPATSVLEIKGPRTISLRSEEPTRCNIQGQRPSKDAAHLLRIYVEVLHEMRQESEC